MPETHELLEQVTLTTVANRTKSPNQFIRRLLYGNHDPMPTEKLELSEITRGREMAPFIKKNGQSIFVGGDEENAYTVATPNIEIARPVKPDEALFKRGPGGNIFAQSFADVSSPAERYIQRQIQVLADLATNAEEFLCAQSLTGTMSYSDEHGDVFTITLPRPAGHTIDLTNGNYWNDTVDPFDDVHEVKRLISEAEGLQPTDVIMSPEAAAAFRANAKVLAQINTQSGITAGGLDLTQFYRDDGAIFVCRMYGLNWWEYPRTVLHPDGTTVKMIRQFYVEFVSATPAAENILHYGAIADYDASESGLFQGERFSKQWIEKRPSRRIFELKTRPLPIPHRWGSMVSMKVAD